jgi:Zn-dependent protease
MISFSDVIELAATRFNVSRFIVLLSIGQDNPIAMILSRVFILNISLAIFNMLPLAPLDGSRLLPINIQEKMMRYQMLVFLGLIMLINFASFALVYPIEIVGNGILGLFSIFV